MLTDVTEDDARRSEGEWLRRELVESRHQVEESLAFAEALNEIGSAVHSTLELDEVLRDVVSAAAHAIGAEASLIEVKDRRGAWAARVTYGVGSELTGMRFAGGRARHDKLAESECAAVAVEDAAEDDRFCEDMLRELGMRGILTLPLRTRDSVEGTISFCNRFPTVFSRSQVAFASRVATTTSLAMENARIYTEEHHIAETLQQALLVVPEDVAGIEFHHVYQSATVAASVGGDFFDVFEMPRSRAGIVIGDVSGKGVEASALASFTRQLIKAHAQADQSPARAMKHTNDLVFRASRTEDFVTAFFGVLDIDEGTLTYCNAGHPSPLLTGPSGVRLVEAAGPILGAWESVRYRDGSVQLGPDDTLVLYTDGVIEARRDGELFGEARLVQLIARLTAAGPAEIPPAVVREVSEFGAGTLRDDVAILCLRRTD